MFIAGDTITATKIQVPARDEFGDPVEDGQFVETEIPGCLFAPGVGAEQGSRFGLNRVGDNQVEAHGILYAPAGTVVAPQDRIRLRGDEYEVLGYSLVWNNSGVEIALHRVTG